MNILLHNLAEQCRTFHRNGHGGYDESFDEEKFAELIVKECIGLRKDIELVGLHPEDYEQGVWEGLQMYENHIKRHFGIEQ